MSLKDLFLYRFLRHAPKDSGLLIDEPAKLETLPRHELFAGGGAVQDWTQYCPPFRYQGPTYYCTAFVATSLGALFERMENGHDVLFSPAELFHRDPYAGSLKGNYLLNAAANARDGFVFEEDIPTEIPDNWSYTTWARLKNTSQATPTMRERGKPYRTKDHAIVSPDTFSMKQALADSPLSIAIPIGRGYWDNVAPNPPAYSITAWHNVLLVNIESDGRFKIFDSLTYKKDFDGFHYLAPDYAITYALSFIDLPNTWKKQQDTEQKKEYGALDHYGDRRILTIEQNTAIRLSTELKNHPTLKGYFGREWTMAINAISYGGFSITDLLNHYTNIRRTGKPIFDLDRKRGDQ